MRAIEADSALRVLYAAAQSIAAWITIAEDLQDVVVSTKEVEGFLTAMLETNIMELELQVS